MKLSVPTTYAALRKQVKETLLLGQRRIDEARTQTYWQTGWLISQHVLIHHSRSEHYGEDIVNRLAEDLGLGSQLLYRCVRFARAFGDFSSLPAAKPSQKNLSGRTNSFAGRLSWSHFRELIKVDDEETRMSFMRRALEKGWTAEKLAEKIRIEAGRGVQDAAAADKNGRTGSRALSHAKLIPKQGTLYTYRLIGPDSVHADEDSRLLKHKVDAKGIPWIDLGFQVHRKLPPSAPKLQPGAIIESLHENGAYSAKLSARREEDLYTYKAFVERVVDADTLLARIDLGFDTRVRQYLRLRGIDAPELSAPGGEGKKAAAFVSRELAKVEHIIITSGRSDKYDRYLADVFYESVAGTVPGVKGAAWSQTPPGSDSKTVPQAVPAVKGTVPSGTVPGVNLIYLNQRLLDEGMAGRV